MKLYGVFTVVLALAGKQGVVLSFPFVPGQSILNATTGNPIPLAKCGSFGNAVDGFPCSPFTLTPFRQVLTTTASFNPPIKQSSGQVCRSDNHCADVFQYDIVGIQVELFSQVLKGCERKPTKLISYGGTVPSATALVLHGREAFIRFKNSITQAAAPRASMWNFEGCTGNKTGVPMAVHNHGQASLAPFDGYAIDRICFGQTKDYMYPNNRPATGWFHDHAVHLTAENVVHGVAGFYMITEKTSLGGCGEPYNLDTMEEVHLLLHDWGITSRCQINYNFAGPHDKNYYADINMVNGRPFPTLTNMQRKFYRFRTLVASVSRPYLLRLVTPTGQDVSSQFCTLIATDGGYFELGPQPFPTEGLMIGVAERWEFVCDFSQLAASVSTVILYNDYDEKRMKDVPYFTYSHYVAKFVFSNGTATGPVFVPNDVGSVGTFAPGNVLQDALPTAIAMANNGQFHRSFEFGRNGGLWAINGETWDSKRVAASNVGQNSWEIWKIRTGGGWFHPVHIHMVDFFVLSRSNVDDGVLSPDLYGLSGAPKDVIYLGPGETIYILARFGQFCDLFASLSPPLLTRKNYRHSRSPQRRIYVGEFVCAC
jgi:FtsP/CotA-like multicopper oxidase with cupredoxin domain